LPELLVELHHLILR